MISGKIDAVRGTVIEVEFRDRLPPIGLPCAVKPRRIDP
jgi:hypothetical protein